MPFRLVSTQFVRSNFVFVFYVFYLGRFFKRKMASRTTRSASLGSTSSHASAGMGVPTPPTPPLPMVVPTAAAAVPVAASPASTPLVAPPPSSSPPASAGSYTVSVTGVVPEKYQFNESYFKPENEAKLRDWVKLVQESLSNASRDLWRSGYFPANERGSRTIRKKTGSDKPEVCLQYVIDKFCITAGANAVSEADVRVALEMVVASIDPQPDSHKRITAPYASVQMQIENAIFSAQEHTSLIRRLNEEEKIVGKAELEARLIRSILAKNILLDACWTDYITLKAAGRSVDHLRRLTVFGAFLDDPNTASEWGIHYKRRNLLRVEPEEDSKSASKKEAATAEKGSSSAPKATTAQNNSTGKEKKDSYASKTAEPQSSKSSGSQTNNASMQENRQCKYCQIFGHIKSNCAKWRSECPAEAKAYDERQAAAAVAKGVTAATQTSSKTQ